MRGWLLSIAPTLAVGFAVTGRCAATSQRAAVSMGFFDQLKKSFENQDYSNSAATYEQTNARASHILVPTEEQANDIKSQLEAGSLDFSEAAVQFSTCNSAARGGKLGKFVPGTVRCSRVF